MVEQLRDFDARNRSKVIAVLLGASSSGGIVVTVAGETKLEPEWSDSLV